MNVAVLVLLSVVYVIDTPVGGPSGGSVVGYTYGALATAGILYLMWFGIRKRSYHARRTTLQGCLSAHVWLGISLAIIVPLHSGFSFGLNVHTLAYALMMVVVLSGIWGAMQYGSLAPQIQSHRGGATLKKLLEQQVLLNNEIQSLAYQKSDAFLALIQKIDFEFSPSFWSAIMGRAPAAISTAQTATFLSGLPDKEHDDAMKLVKLVDRKQELVQTTLNEVQILARLKLWLYIHLPVSFALLAALAIHIFSVFYFR